MKFSLDLSAFAEALGVVGKASTGKHIRPILANILIHTGEGEVRLVGTDMEIMVLARIPATIERPGHFTIPAKLLTDIVGSIPTDTDNESMRFEQESEDDPSIRVTCGRNRFRLQIQGIEEFPPIPNLEGEEFPRFEMKAGALGRGLKEVAIAMGSEEATVSQRSVSFNFRGDRSIVLVATDSKRLAVTSIADVDYPEDFNKVFLVPTKAVTEIIKLVSEGERIGIGLFKQQLVFISSRFSLLTRLIDGKFPDYNRVLPKERSRRAVMSRRDLAQALRAVRPIASLSSHMLHIDLGVNEARIWSESQEQGMSEVFLPITLEGEPVNISFNDRFITDFLAVVDSDDVVMEMTTPSYPGVFKSGEAGSPFVYVVMPMTF